MEPSFLSGPKTRWDRKQVQHIEAAPKSATRIAGGVKLAGWKNFQPLYSWIAFWKPAERFGLQVDVPLVNGRLFEFRQLWINKRQSCPCKSMNGESMDRILRWNKDDDSGNNTATKAAFWKRCGRTGNVLFINGGPLPFCASGR
mgnify:CR=1 FL=1